MTALTRRMRPSCRFRTAPTPSVRAVPRKPYRSPRDWLDTAQSSHFGHGSADGFQWQKPETALDEALLAAAQMQNDLAFRIRIAFTYNNGTSAVASFSDLHPDTVRDILNGSKHATLSVLYALARGVGLDAAVALTRPDDRTLAEQRDEHRSAPPSVGTNAARD